MSEHLHNTISKAKKLSGLFIIWSIVFFIVALLLQHTVDDDTAGTMLIRSGFWAVGGFILLYLLKQMKDRKRSGWLRLSVISVLAPIGAVAFIVFTPHLPLWFDVAQIGGAIILAIIAVLVLSKETRVHFPKTPKA